MLILSDEEFNKIVNARVKEILLTFEIDLKEIMDNKIAEALDQHLEDYMHSETPLTVAERDEETAQQTET